MKITKTMSVKFNFDKSQQVIKMYKNLGYTSFNKYCKDLIERELNDYTNMAKITGETNQDVKKLIKNINMSNTINNQFFKFFINSVKDFSADLKGKDTDEIMHEIYKDSAVDYLNKTDLTLYPYIEELNLNDEKEEEIKDPNSPIIIFYDTPMQLRKKYMKKAKRFKNNINNED